MADPTQNPIESGLSYATKMNPYGQTADELKANIEAGQKGVEALQQRYANPNWFNVAAGFFKPQLGGFGASLGSASEALGDWVEKQRANELPIYNAQQQLQFMKNQLMQRQIAQEKAKVAINQPGGPTHSDTADISLHDPNVGKIVSEQEATTKALRDQALAEWDRNKTWTQEFAFKYPKTVLDGLVSSGAIPAMPKIPGMPTSGGPMGVGNAPTGSSSTTSAGNVAPANNTGFVPMTDTLNIPPPGVSQAAWNNMSVTDRIDRNNELAKANAAKALGNKDTAGDIIKHSSDALDDLTVIRTLATSPGVGKMLGLTSGPEAMKALFGYLTSGGDPNKLTPLQEVMTKLQGEAGDQGKEAYDQFVNLQHYLNKYVADARGTIQNPSNGAQNLIASGKPSVLDSQKALVKLADLMAFDHSAKVREGMLRQQWSGDPNEFESSHTSPYGNLREQLRAERALMAKNPVNLQTAPAFYAAERRLQDLMRMQNATAGSASAAAPTVKPKRMGVNDYRNLYKNQP
jgi:hypothetical protein